MTKHILTSIFTVCLVGFLSISCRSEQAANQEMTKFGPNNPVSLVVFFQKETPVEQIETLLTQRRSDDKGYNLPEGVALRFMVRNGDYIGYAMTFSTDATNEQKRLLKDSLSKSPLVYKIFENVVPSEIKDL